MEKKWEEMNSDERQEEMFAKWLSPEGVEFVSPEAEKQYKARVTRIKDAIQLKKLPDRVPAFLYPSFFPVYYSGMTPQEVMYDYDKCYQAFKKYMVDFEPDVHIGMVAPGSGKFLETVDYRLYAWPGHGVPPEHPYQAIEGEYMKADEYDLLIHDPSFFFTSIWPARIFGVMEPLHPPPNLTGVAEIYGVPFSFIPFGLPHIQAAYKALMEAGNEALKWAGVVGAFNKEMAETGFPNIFGGGVTKAPFDMIGDTLRGTRGIMTDLYRQPDKLLEALEAIVPTMINLATSLSKMTGNPMVFIPLHKGADGFLSDEQYKKFYWPTFRKVLMGIIDEGCVPNMAVEGCYNSRLEIIGDLPKGTTLWNIDQSDMAKAKATLGKVACLSGNIPVSLLAVGTPQQIKDYVKNLIDTVGKGGGFIVNTGAFFDQANPENVKAMIDFTKEYGVYK
ncbi:MAG: uroporphyrinogen decarboxylase family protein [Dehalococcoidales bacterium]